jgi:hypothetical protein
MPLMQPPVALASCERSLRDLLTVVLRAKFGPDWISHVFDEEAVTKLRQTQEVEQKRRTRRGVVAVPANLIEHAEYSQLTRLILRHWDALNGALGAKKEMSVLLDRFEALRNTVAHSRELLPFDEELLSAIAGEIRNRVRFSQWRSFPVPVEDECGAGYVADSAGTECDVLEGSPAFLQFRRGPLAGRPHVSDQRIRGAGSSVQGGLGAAFGAAYGHVNTDAGADVALVGERG